jgi:hypothetical protein
MMVRAGFPSPDSPQDSLYSAVMDRASHASTRRLALLLAGTMVGAALVLGAAQTLWPLAALCGTGSAIALWGLVAHETARHPIRVLNWLQQLLVVLGTLLAVVAGLAIFLWILGPRWML